MNLLIHALGFIFVIGAASATIYALARRLAAERRQRETLQASFDALASRRDGAAGVVTDSADRVRAKQTLEVSERTYRMLFDLHPTPLWAFDEETHRVLKVNDAALKAYGYSREEFLELRIEQLRDPQQQGRLREHFRSADRTQVFFGEWVHRRKDGTTLDVQIHSHSLELDGRSARLVMATDVTEKLRAERALVESEATLRTLNQQLEDRIFTRTEELLLAKERAERADKVKSMFLATVSHELRTPLNSIIGFSEILLQGLAGPLNDEQSKQVRIVNSSGKHLLALITDFLDISKIEAGVLSLQNSEFDLQELLGPDMHTHESAAHARGLEFDFVGESGAERCRVNADAKRVRQIVDNLLSNAIKFTDSGGVSLQVSHDPEGVRVTVADTGIGIVAGQIERLFEPFARVESPGARTRDGTGLGLAIAKRLAEAMGGRIGVVSDPSMGSRFWFTLPRAER